MSMLPWIVAEIRTLSTKSSKEEPSVSQIRLYVSPASLRRDPDAQYKVFQRRAQRQPNPTLRFTGQFAM
ncbi:tbc1 domain family member 1 isoform x3 [Limosa lapponica baueri]|uniref:Tbc1 domain family member 1 isoform x3 n=1 Tax=Limosa lapponica baueri TaxID=1758121 RepID=A0A2I0TCL4_LIMLA|nr:tbc1 domain family member 1 isoform x3 [Limosa lapponica baueri]